MITQMTRLPGVRYPVLVPNQKGLDNLLSLLSTHPSSIQPPPTDEIAIFTASTDDFAKANTNTTVSDSLARLAPVARVALDNNLRVRGYVSCVIACPYSGKVNFKKVREVTKELFEMGCYEVSLGDTVGVGTPREVGEMLEEVKKEVAVDKLAGHVNQSTFATIHMLTLFHPSFTIHMAQQYPMF